jgi:ATP-dependent DNA helicase RecG
LSYLEDDLTLIKGIGKKRADLFKNMGIETIGDLLRDYPRSYQDFSEQVAISESIPGEVCCIKAMVMAPVRCVLVRRGMTLYKLRAADDTGECEITFFNNKYVTDMLHTGSKYLFYGRMGGSLLRREMTSPEFETDAQAAGLMPIYSTTASLASRVIRSAVKQALALCDTLDDPLPDSVRTRYQLCYLRFALENIHFPKTRADLETARRRLVFEELLALQIGMLLMKNHSRAVTGVICAAAPDFSDFYKNLPFEPTNAQKRAINEAASDMRRHTPMNRLIEGDVGSGKTLVAAALCYYAAKCGLQSAMMAPTEILAHQHFHTMSSLLAGCGVSVGLLSGGLKPAEKLAVKNLLVTRKLDMVVGTHALLQENVAFDNLGLVITDEQHRFGVEQRAVLSSKGQNPHVLIMSATPIPRTLGLIIYGDLDISVLDELPHGRQSVKTYLVDSSLRRRMYAFIKRQLDSGFQAYIVCPLIEADESGLAAAEEYAQKIAIEDFRGYRVGMLHGKLKAQEKERIMGEFVNGSLNLLVSTTVIEVGVDVPNAVIMAVENAERFGLSQLHQLRGRVGRGSAQSYCILISDVTGGDTKARLKTMTDTSDGFKIAEKDLAARGPGDFFGRRQHGLPELSIASLMDDISVLGEARECALSLLRSDPLLKKPKNASLRTLASRLFSDDRIIFN